MASSTPSSRPLSPHLSIYRFHFSMAMSILHRAAGVACAGMLALLVVWLWAAAYSAECFIGIHDFLASTLGQVLLLASSFVFYFKFATGMRHLVWDMGKGFTKCEIDATGYAAIAFAVVCTAVTWAIVWGLV